MSSKFSFHDHGDLRGQHALFSPSQSAWLRYEDEKIEDRVLNQYRAAIGTEIHEYAAMQITLGHRITNIRSLVHGVEDYIYTKYTFTSLTKEISSNGISLMKNVSLLPKEVFEAVRFYINDGVGYKMTAEQPLVYSDNIFGTADSISYRQNTKTLRIHDLKTGALQAHMEQLATYAALFCLEYGPKYEFKPGDLNIELRIYQWDGITINNPTAEDIVPIMNRIIHTEKIASKVDKED